MSAHSHELSQRGALGNGFLRWLGAGYLRLTGWQVDANVPKDPKYVAIFAPHTSNWDFPYMMSIIFVLGIRAHWFGKRELFRGPLAPILRWMGGIPIDRSARGNMVDQMAAVLDAHDELVIGVAPEGTRSQTPYWKSGFYHMAHKAKVPIAFAYLDYARKLGGMVPGFKPSGNIENDMELIREFFSGVQARYPEAVGAIALKPQSSGPAN
jgi:1-acyl-sn-glycerol-3-phosphate acyltransferase